MLSYHNGTANEPYGKFNLNHKGDIQLLVKDIHMLLYNICF